MPIIHCIPEVIAYESTNQRIDKTVDLLETYFKIGGIQFQLNYVQKVDLIDAKEHPENHPDLRVRVTGFSEFFSRLDESVQDSVIERLENMDI